MIWMWSLIWAWSLIWMWSSFAWRGRLTRINTARDSTMAHCLCLTIVTREARVKGPNYFLMESAASLRLHHTHGALSKRCTACSLYCRPPPSADELAVRGTARTVWKSPSSDRLVPSHVKMSDRGLCARKHTYS